MPSRWTRWIGGGCVLLGVAFVALAVSSAGYVVVQGSGGDLVAAAFATPTFTPLPPTATASPSPTPTSPVGIRPPELPPLRVADLLTTTRAPLPAGVDPRRVRTLIVTGDVIPARYVNYKLTARGDFIYPFRATIDVLKDGDVRFINLEAPLLRRCPVVTSGYQFCGDVRFVEALKWAAIDMVNLANNHAGDYGVEGVEETIAHLKAANIGVTGRGEIAYLDVRGVRFAFLGYNGIGVRFDREKIRRQVAEARRAATVVVVQFHWGKEYVSTPAIEPGVADDDPREIGRLAIDAGADLVVGNHPHVVQGIEIYQGKLIAYSHGNFLFDQMFQRDVREGVIGRYVFYDRWLVSAHYFPTLLDDYTQPRLLQGADAEAVLKRMRDASLQLLARPFLSRTP
ncbi:MAG: CapA family protein [Dehalococcoidia bacterium]|nr:CapA family protein [Dehalococcoidia bacterium]